MVRLLGPFDPYLQARDRELLVEDPGRAKELWRMLGRPGAVLVAGEVVGTWRPRAAGRALTLQVQLWGEPTAVTRTRLEEQAERLAAFRGVRLAGVEVA